MKCVICKRAETVEGKTTITLERDGLTLVIKHVPAFVCPDCGEAYVTEDVTAQLLRTAEETAMARAVVDIRDYSPGR